MTQAVSFAVPCRTDEPGLARTLALAWEAWRAWPPAASTALEVLVCLNGDEPDAAPALADVRAFAAARGVPCRVADVDAGAEAAAATGDAVAVLALLTRREGKAGAWNLLRSRARGDRILFLDADVRFAPDVPGRLLDALAQRPDAILASGRTTCAPRPTPFERIMATPYAIEWPNLSPQCYAARRDGLPARMPEDLLDPERWLELTVGWQRIARDPAARVVVRVPATLRDFVRQRVRLEVAKLQLAERHPGLSSRGAPQPGASHALASLGPANAVRALVYLTLRRACALAARRRWRRGETAGVWRQPVSTKRWDVA